MNTKLIIRYFLGEVLSIIGMAVALFWSAGRMDWWPAWAAIAVMTVCLSAIGITILRFQPNLLVERSSPPRDSKTWDKTILSILRLTQLARYILAGLDQRYGWTGGFSLAVQIVAIDVCILAYANFAWALASNNFFSQIVRIQTDRGHAVVADGPYHFVRHPAYAGMLLFELAMSTLLASWWSIVAGALCAILFIIRTTLEDSTLQSELSGYADYASKVRYRLFPGIW